MNTTDEQIINEVLGRMAADAPEPIRLDDLGTPTLEMAISPTRYGRRLGILAGLVLIVASVGMLLRPQPPSDGVRPVGPVADATFNELERAIQSGLESLEHSVALEGVEESHIGPYLASRVWFSIRSNGDTIVIQQVDVDVRDTAWWLTAAEPPRVGERIATTARVLVDGVMYEAVEAPDGSEPWSPIDAPRGPLALGLAFVAGDGDLSDLWLAPAGEVTRQATADRGTIWTLTATTDVGRALQRFYIHADGYLASSSVQRLDGGADPAREDIPFDSATLTYTPLRDPEPIAAPQIGTRLDLAVFDLPDGWRIGR